MANDTLKAIATKYNVAEDQISAILSALNIKTEKPSEIQIIGFEKVCNLMKGGTPLEKAAQAVADEAKAKATTKDNSVPAPKVTIAEREAQLKEVAVRHAIAHDRIPEILGAMNLKLETLTDAQIEVFGDVCQMLHSGMALEMASQAAVNNAKAKASAKDNPETAQAVAGAKQVPSKSTAITSTKERSMPGLVVQSTPMNEEQRKGIDAMVSGLAPHAVPNLIEIAAQEAIAINSYAEDYTRAALVDAVVNSPKMNTSAEDAIKRFNELKAERAAKRNEN
jgi:hypothetical protein